MLLTLGCTDEELGAVLDTVQRRAQCRLLTVGECRSMIRRILTLAAFALDHGIPLLPKAFSVCLSGGSVGGSYKHPASATFMESFHGMDDGTVRLLICRGHATPGHATVHCPPLARAFYGHPRLTVDLWDVEARSEVPFELEDAPLFISDPFFSSVAARMLAVGHA
jgi:hypothetical protein